MMLQAIGIAEKDVGDSLEIIIKTPKKQNYIDNRFKSNQMLTRVKYSITALMFNHVISGIESVFSSLKSHEEKKKKYPPVIINLI